MGNPLVDVAAMTPHLPRRLVLLAIARSVGALMLALLVYALIPIRAETAGFILVGAMIALFLLGVLFVRQLGRVSRAARPVLAAIEAIAFVFGMFLALFAFVYVSLDASGGSSSFTQPVDKIAGVYFSVTVLATVGFGDIAPVTDAARIAVTCQMVLDLVLIGTALRLMTKSAKDAVQVRLAGHATQVPGASMPEGQEH